jgi:hypothetical protein
MLPVPLYCPFLIAHLVFSNVYFEPLICSYTCLRILDILNIPFMRSCKQNVALEWGIWKDVLINRRKSRSEELRRTSIDDS